MHFVIDKEMETQCNFGEWYDYDGAIIINLANIDSPEEFITVIMHEELHEYIDWGVYPHVTTEKQDHWIIPRMLC